MIKVFFILCIIGIIFCLLYINGISAIQSKRALVYIGSLRGNRAKFVSCTGYAKYAKRIIRFEESKIYRNKE